MMKSMISSSSAILPCSISRSFFSHCKKQKPFDSLPFKKPRSSFLCLRIGVQEIAELAQNKAFMAVAVSTVIGQLSKPFTSALYGNGFNHRAIFQSGGMPSTHSAGVVAVATSLGFERGLSDSVFGMSVVFAAIVMYDAQFAFKINHTEGRHLIEFGRVVEYCVGCNPPTDFSFSIKR